jgi:hypothetical protein
MKVNTTMLLAALAAATAPAAHGATVFSDNFNSYSDGNLVGQGSWAQLGSNATNPVQVNSMRVVNMTTDQDVQKAFMSSVAKTDGQLLVTEFDFSVSDAGNDDFFAHISPSLGNTNFYNRFYTQDGTGANTFQLALAASAVTGGVVNLTYGGDLNLGQTYHVTSVWHFVAGTTNDVFRLFVDNLPYAGPLTWDSSSAEPATLGVFNLRQAAGNAATIATLDNVVVTHVIPEPAALALAMCAAWGLTGRRRR